MKIKSNISFTHKHTELNGYAGDSETAITSKSVSKQKDKDKCAWRVCVFDSILSEAAALLQLKRFLCSNVMPNRLFASLKQDCLIYKAPVCLTDPPSGPRRKSLQVSDWKRERFTD